MPTPIPRRTIIPWASAFIHLSCSWPHKGAGVSYASQNSNISDCVVTHGDTRGIPITDCE
jgi:hypothetical protein